VQSKVKGLNQSKSNKINSENNREYNFFSRANTENWLTISFIASLLVIFIFSIIVYFIFSFYGDIETLSPDILKLFVVSSDNFHPEPAEQLSYIVSLVGSALLLFGVSIFIGKRSLIQNFLEKIFIKFDSKKNLVWTVAFIILALICFNAMYAEDFYYLLLTPFGSLFGFSFCLILTVVYTKLNLGINFQKAFLYSTLGLIFILQFLINNVGPFDSYAQYIDGHFDQPLYSVVRAYAKQNPLGECGSQYGLFGTYLLPFFLLFGLSVSKYSVLMALLTLFFIYSVSKTCSVLLENLWLKFLPLLAYIATACFLLPRVLGSYWMSQGKAYYYDPYFQYIPIRTFGPSIIMLFFVLNETQSRKAIPFLGTFIVTFFLFWNIDTGSVSFLTWLLYLIYREFCLNQWKNLIKQVFSGILSGLFAFSIYYLLIYGYLPNIQNALDYQKIFYVSGYSNIPITAFQSWNILILFYFIGLCYSLLRLFEQNKAIKTKAIFVFSILGLGLFAYFQGRSHPWVLLAVTWPGFIVMGILAEIFFQRFKASLQFIAVFLYLGLTWHIFSTAYEVKSGLWNRISRLENQELAAEYEQLKKMNNDNKDFLVFSFHPGVIHAETNTAPLFCPSCMGMILTTDFQRLKTFLTSNTSDIKPIFVEKQWLEVAPKMPEWREIFEILMRDYKVVEQTSNKTFMKLSIK
jgi:hypothetical protein